METSLITTMATPSKKRKTKAERRLAKRARRNAHRRKCRRERARRRDLWTIDHRCVACHSPRRWCPCGSTTKELLIRAARADTLEDKNVRRRRYPNPNAYMVPLTLVSHMSFSTKISINALFTDPLVAKLRAAGFITRKGHWSAKVYKRWKKRFERRAAYFATEEGQAQSACVIAEAML